MYIPPHFACDDAVLIKRVIEENSFGTLVSNVNGRPFATHLPFLFDRDRLRGHMARANPHWQSLAASGDEALVIFQGPHAYVSPSWYTEPGVPTWNYAAVHVYGAFAVIEDDASHREVMRVLTEQHEQSSASPWRADFDEPMVAGMLNGTVAFDIVISEVQGKMKMSQNRSLADRQAVIRELKSNDSDNARGTAQQVQDLL